MVKDLWEFMDKEAKARIIFIGVLIGVVALIAIPYLINVLSHHETNVGADLPDYTEIIAEADSEPASSSEEATTKAESSPDSNAESTPEPTSTEPAETAAYATYSRSTPASASQPVAQTAAAPSEPVHRTTVDDNSGRDDGYTASGIDDPGTNDPMQSDAQTDGEGSEV
ncbi:hypothetical protein IKF89_00580 [Candidatus Saccharibacteria bacterium]|nr:hypothetical protein [Candidatus Saccharibacteria bacterium]